MVATDVVMRRLGGPGLALGAGTATLDGALLIATTTTGIYLSPIEPGSSSPTSATLTDVAVLDTVPAADLGVGGGIQATQGAGLQAERVLLRGQWGVALFTGADREGLRGAINLTDVTIVDTVSGGAGGQGRSSPGWAAICRPPAWLSGTTRAPARFSIPGSAATLTALTVTGTRPLEGTTGFGDGISVLDGSVVTIEGALIEGVARAAVAAFGAKVTIGNAQLRCNPLALAYETFRGTDGQIVDGEGNSCVGSIEGSELRREALRLPGPLLGPGAADGAPLTPAARSEAVGPGLLAPLDMVYESLAPSPAGFSDGTRAQGGAAA